MGEDGGGPSWRCRSAGIQLNWLGPSSFDLEPEWLRKHLQEHHFLLPVPDKMDFLSSGDIFYLSGADIALV